MFLLYLLSLLFTFVSHFVVKSNAFLATNHATAPHSMRVRGSPLEAVAVLYDSMGGNTEQVAGYIADAFGVKPLNINDVSVDQVKEFDCFVVGAPTWHTDADQERSGTGWDGWLYQELKEIDFDGKKVACFGVGDSVGYADNFVDAMEELHSCFKAQKAEMHGYTDPAGYQHDDSKALIDGVFCGLPLDEDNESEMSEDRCKAWVSKLQGVGFE